MTDIERLKDFVSSEILPEINALISYLGSERITTVEGFAAMSGKTLKDMWNITPPALVFDKFYERISLLTRDLMNDYIIGDIDNPSNPREKSRADHVWSAFHNKFSGMRAVVVRNLTNEFLVTYPLSATGHSFAAFFALDNPNFETYFTDEFKVNLANSYIEIAEDYLRTYDHYLRLYGRITDDGAKPIRKVRINVLDEANGQELGYETMTNHEGLFAYDFSIVHESLPGSYRHTVYFRATGEGFADKDFQIVYAHDDPDQITDISLEPLEPPSTLITSIFTGGQIDSELLDLLSSNINPNLSEITFSDLRSNGLLRNQKGQNLSGTAKDQMDKLDGLALFELINLDVSVSEAIYDDVNGGYGSPIEAAAAPRTRFIVQHEDKFPDGKYGAALFHEACVKQTMLATTRMAQTRDGLTPPLNEDEFGNPILPELEVEKTCGCDDCESAVGPQAYLADLLSFVASNMTETVDNVEAAIDTSWIKERLHQDLGAIPADCKQLENTVCQARIATEVLVSKAAGNMDTNLENARIQYVQNSYRDLLIKLGTNYEELQRYQTITEEKERENYAHRLGIVYKYADNDDEIQETIRIIYKDISSLTTDDEVALLYRFFGLPPTYSPDPATEGNWLQKWKRFRLRELWEERDYFSDPYYLKEKAIIDPDVVTVDDFRHPDDTLANMKAFEIWVNRRRFLDGKFKNLYDISIDDSGSQNTLANAFSRLEQSAYTYTTIDDTVQNPGNIWPGASLNNLKTLLNNIDNGTETEDTLWDAYHLHLNELRRLLDLEALDKPDELISREDRCEAINLLLQVVKREFTLPRSNDVIWWVEEEVSHSVLLSAQEFWVSETEPKEGQWPIYDSEDALVDPQLITQANLTEITFRKEQNIDPLGIYESRLEELNQFRRTTLADVALSMKEKINISFEDTNYSYDDDPQGTAGTLSDLKSKLDDPQTSEAAVLIISDTLLLGVEDFLFLMRTGAKSMANEEIPSADIERQYSILTYIRKIHSFYTGESGWLSEEESYEYWRVRKARLPKWRASVSERTEWKNALQSHNERPIIDADLIGPAYLRNPAPTDPAFDLWQERYSIVHGTQGIYDQISGESFDSSQNVASYNFLLKKYLFDGTSVTLSDFIERKAEGADISRPLEQLQITFTDFNFLVNCFEFIQNGKSLSDDQKERLYYLLTKVRKKREYYIQRLEEADHTVAGKSYTITQSQDFFIDRKDDYTVYPPDLPYALNPYLATSQELSEWRRKVVSRIEEEKEILRSLDEMLLEADDENIPFLRDAYIDFFPIEGAELSERARKLGDELFIDLQDNCCSKTNRVAQGVETLQQLIWKTHTNDVLSHYPGIKLHVEDFDSVWQWMGTYANWRASMFMFLYPENLLLPSLRAIATPGFRAVLETTQNNRRFNPEDACRVAIDYRTYLSDIKSLDVKCSAEIEMIVQKEDVCAGLSQMRKDLVFVFATAANSGRTYFTAVSDSEFGFDQMRNWTRIENLPQNAVIKGCDFYKNGTYGVNHIYLFYLLPGIEERSNFYALRFSLDDNRWEDEPIQFTLEKDRFRIEKTDPLYERPPADLLENMDLTIQELVVCANTHYWQAPTIAINLFSSSESYGVENIVLAFSHSIAAKGIGFGSGDYDYWRCYIRGDVIDPTEYSSSHDPVLESSSTVGYIQNYAFKQGENFDGENYWHDFRFYFHLSDTPNTEEGKKNNIVLVKRNDMLQLVSVAVAPIESFNFLYESDFISFIPTPDKSELFIIYQEGTALKYALIDDFGTNGLSSLVPFFLNPGTKLIQQYTRKGHDPNRINLVTQNALGSNSIRLTSFTYDHATGAVSWGNAFYPTQPQLTEIPGMNPDISSPERQMFGDSGRIATEMNASSDNPRIFDFVEEAYFFLPLEIATSLSQNGYYSEALDWYRLVYDFYAPLDQRKIYYGLVLEEDLESLTDRMDDWYKDPFNPHGIAHTRQNAYTRYVLISIANCLLAYANSEFTFDNSESVPRARELYEDMTDLLSVLAPSNPCEVEEVIRDLSSYIDHDVVWKYLWKDLFDRLNHVDTPMSEFQSLVNEIDEELNDYDTIVDEVQKSQVFKNVETLIDVAMETEGSTMDGILNKHKNHLMTLEGALLSSDKDTPYQTAGRKGAESIGTAMMTITGFSSAELATQNLDWLVEDVPAEVADDRKPDPMDYSKGSQNGRYISLKPWDALEINNPFPHIRISGMPFMFCVVPNPIVAGLRMAALGNLYKIHNCMNIAGMKRELSPFAAPTDATSGVPSIGVGGSIQVPGQLSIPPSNYRYGYLVERAKQLVTMAAQMESSFMQYLERYDSESFSKLKAQQDLEMAKANIKLQDLKYKEAESHLNLASLQRDRAQIQVDGLQGMIEAGLLSAEQNLVANYMDLGSLQAVLATLSAMENATNYLVTAVADGGLGTPAATALAVVAAKYGFMKSLVQIDVTKLQTEISINSLYASLQRRQQEWEYQKSIAHQDLKIGTQQIKIANDRIRIVGQEREIAELQMTHAEATLDFLKTKFTNAELYEWMSGVLEDVYSYFLQEATATAKLAEQQLSFERQISLPNLIKSDYWSINTNSFSPSIGSGEVDRRGLTGSARLLKDLTELEQYAFDTTQRKLQITKTISLNEYDPIQMEIFRQTGVYNFTLTNNEFDKDYPGHYMRLIRRVGVAVIALVPPVKGIKATLTNSGISSVVTGSVIFQKKTIARMPERIVLSSPYNDYGVFDLQPDQNQYLPFEGSGVETSWELRMEKPANLFDFRSIADVLLTVEYEAMHSEIYANIIKGGLNSRAPGRSIILSVKNDLPDVWYDLQNGVDTDEGFSSQFTIADSDLTPHDVHPKITNCKIFLSHDISEGEEFSFGDNGKLILSLNGSGGQEIDLNTFLVNPTSPQVATGFAEMSPLGEWGIELTNSMQVRELMEVDKLNDILIIINYTVDPIPFAQ